MRRVTDRVKRFYAKTKKPARLNMSLEPVSGLRTVHLARILATKARALKANHVAIVILSEAKDLI
jgi:hypothetical protein